MHQIQHAMPRVAQRCSDLCTSASVAVEVGLSRLVGTSAAFGHWMRTHRCGARGAEPKMAEGSSPVEQRAELGLRLVSGLLQRFQPSRGCLHC